jgi:hypothetical protein
MVLFLRETAWWKAESRRHLLDQNKNNYKFSTDKLSGSGSGSLCTVAKNKPHLERRKILAGTGISYAPVVAEQ